MAQWIAFIAFALIAIGGALGMTTTMSMFRSGIFLMASFIGVAGLFILLSADLIGLLQVMMYVGGMLVMILFMVLFMHDPGGSMMAGMDMSPVENFFSRGIKPMDMEMDDGDGGEHPHHKESAQPGMHPDGGEDDKHGGGGEGGMDMSMTTPVKKHAAVLAIVVGCVLVALLLLRPSWPISAATLDPASAEQIGTLLMGKYMMAFEGAGLLILTGIFGAVLLARPGRHPGDASREAHVAVDEDPAPITDDPLKPLDPKSDEPLETSITDIHRDR